MALTEEQIQGFKDKHGELIAIEARDGGLLIFRAPRRTEYDQWFDKRADRGTAAARELAQSTLVYPGRDDLLAALDKQPALLMCKNGILDAITSLAGLDDEGATIKKL